MRSLTRCSTIKTRWGTHQSLFTVSPDPVWSVRTRVKSKPTEYFLVTISCDVYSLSAGRQRRRRQRRVNKVDKWIIQDQRRSSLRPPRLFCLETTPAAGLKGTFEDETIKKKTVTKNKTKREARLWMHKPLQSVLLPQAETGDRRRCRLVWSLLPFSMKHKCLEPALPRTAVWEPKMGVTEWFSLGPPLARVESINRAEMTMNWSW